MYYIYLLKHTKTKQIYIGLTNNLKRRIKEHNSNQQKATVRIDGKWKVIYVEIYRNKEDAHRREQRFKQHGRAKQELLKRIEKSLEI